MEQQEERDTYLENLDLGGYIYFHDDFTLEHMKTVIEYWASLPAAKNVQFDVACIDEEQVDILLQFIQQKQSISSVNMLIGDARAETWEKANKIALNLPESINTILILIHDGSNREEMDLFCKNLAKNENLTSVEIENARDGNLPIELLLANTVNCETLIISYHKPQDMERVFESLANNKTVKSLKITLMRLEDAEMLNIELQNFSKCLKENSTLTALSFQGWERSNLFEQLAEVLETTKTIQSLQLVDCEGNVSALRKGISQNSGSLQVLNFDSLGALEGEIDLLELFKLNATKQSFKTLGYNGDAPHNSQLDEILSWFKQNTSLVALDLDFSNEASDDLVKFYEAIPENVEEFAIQAHPISSAEVVVQICKKLKDHASLKKTSLYLEGDQAFLALTEHFPVNVALSLQVYGISSVSIAALIKVIEENPSISFDSVQYVQSLDFIDGKNFIDGTTLTTLMETWNANATLVKDFKCTSDFTKEEMVRFREVFARNYTIESCDMQWSAYRYEAFEAITNRNKYLNKQKRFKVMKVASENTK